jgi:hypothetical protein
LTEQMGRSRAVSSRRQRSRESSIDAHGNERASPIVQVLSGKAAAPRSSRLNPAEAATVNLRNQ